MNRLRFILLAVTLIALSGCASGGHCDKRKLYSSAQNNEPVAVPEDLDAPASSKDLVIPEPAPATPRDEKTGCIEAPPQLPASIS